MSTVPLVLGNHEPGEMMPVDVARRTQRETTGTKALTDALLQLVERLEGESKERIIQYHRRGVRLQKLYEGDYGDFHPSGTWMSRPGWGLSSKNKRTGKTSAYYPHNKTRRYIDAAVAQAFQSRIDLRAISTSDDDRSELAASMARPIVDHHEQQIFTEEFVTDEEKQKRFFGQVFYFNWYNYNAGPLVDDLGVDYEDYSPGGSIYTCLRCSQSGDEEDFGLMGGCPQCGSTAVQEEQMPIIKMPKIVAKGKKHAGDCMITIVPSLQMNYDRATASFDQALWYDWTRRFRIEEIQQVFPNYKVPEQRDTSGSYDRSGIDLLEDSTGNTGGGIRYRKTAVRRATAKAVWLRSAMLESIILDTVVPLAGGDSIPAGVKLSEVWPHALYLLICGRDVIDLWDDPLIDYRWVQLKHNHIPNRTDGDGNEDVIRPAQEYNTMRSMSVASVIFNAARPQWIRAPLAAADFTGQFGYIGTVKGMRPEDDMRKYHHVADPNPLDQSVVMMLEGADAEMRDTLAAYSTVTGDSSQEEGGGGTKTLGGMEMLNTSANAQRLPEFALRACAYRKLHLNLLHIFRECATEERYVPFYGKAGELAGQYFKGADLEGDIDLLYGKGSYVPKDQARRRANLMWAMNVGAGIILNPQCPPSLKQYILEVAECDVELDSFEEDVKEARRMVEEMKRLSGQAQQMAQMIGQVAPPIVEEAAAQGMEAPPPPNAAQLLLQMVPIDPKVHELPIHFEFVRKWLKSDESRKCDPVVKEAMRLRLDEIEQAGAARAAEQQQLAMQANAPQMAMEQSQQDQQTTLAQNQKSADNAQQQGLAAEDRSHKMELQDRKLASEREIATMKAKQTKTTKR